MPFIIVRNDITKMKVDAIVNAANESLQMGGGVCGAIFRAAGADELHKECAAIGFCKTGQAVITSGHKLLAKHIVHTPGPVWRGGTQGEEELLRSCYETSLLLAKKHDCESIAFPLISSGIYGYPKDQALRVASNTILEFLTSHDMTVYPAVFDKEAFSASEKIFGTVQAFIDAKCIEETPIRRVGSSKDRILRSDELLQPFELCTSQPCQNLAQDFTSIVEHLEEDFTQTLLHLIQTKNKTEVEIYKKANIDRKLFSKIRNSKTYTPSKKTAIAFAVALELDLVETEKLLNKAGFTLSRSQKFDVIIEYFITRRMFDVFKINEALFYFNQPLLGSTND